jgi:hypothetical protein
MSLKFKVGLFSWFVLLSLGLVIGGEGQSPSSNGVSTAKIPHSRPFDWGEGADKPSRRLLIDTRWPEDGFGGDWMAFASPFNPLSNLM